MSGASMGKWALLAMICTWMAGCGTDNSGVIASPAVPTETTASHADKAPKPVDPGTAGITIRTPMTISNNLLPGTSRKDMYLRLQLVRGTYSENWTSGAYRGTLYEGRYQIVIADAEGQTLSATRLDKLFPDPLIFTEHFSLAFDDYNGDGFPDFTLGQRGDSKGGYYKILTIAQDLTIQELPVRGAPFVYISKGEEVGSSYSLKLRKSKSGLVSFSSYNRDQSKYADYTLQWQNGEFVPTHG